LEPFTLAVVSQRLPLKMIIKWRSNKAFSALYLATFSGFSTLNRAQWQEFQVLFCLKTDNFKVLGPLS
jgi:hypothetical protein